MKTKYIIGLWLCVIITPLIGLFTITKSPAQGNPHRISHAIVIIGDVDTYYRGTNFEYIQTGLQVQWIEASPNVVKVPVGASLAESIAYYMEQGFSYEPNQLGSRHHILKR